MTGAMNMNLIYCFFDAANMHRWNDHIRPIDLTELDKQAHKAAIAWILGKYEEQEHRISLDWDHIIEFSMFSFIERLILTDLKPELFHQLKKEKFDEVNDYVMSEYDRLVPDSDVQFRSRLEEYIRSENKTIENDVVRAAHYMATNWEFNLIYEMNKKSVGIEQTRANIYMELKEHMNLVGVKNILNSQSQTFIDLFGQLRFQQRWTRVPRIPQTTVLGHSLMVANMIYLHDLDEKTSEHQKYNDYYTALFHDLPEVLTKDVISPVKVNVKGLTKMLDEYEFNLMNSKVMPLIPEAWRDEFGFLVFDPFKDKDDKRFGKVSGKNIKLCDVFGAYMEAFVSRRYGVTSARLRDGETSLRKRLIDEGTGINATALIDKLNSMRV
ncbi:MAG: YfbR-like 5'-deoxynucleotidase [Candidatus Methanomethylophilaceae archaeon]